ncbi:MAG: hypothetical protein OSJ76_01160 [Alphaproteobacteria bacterium]|nr:hypothetical protein [Alphaproteobacteria bacterium]
MKSIEEVKLMLELAAEVDKSQPRVKAQDAKAIWPEILLTDTEKKALKLMTRDGRTDVFYSDEQIKVWETVTTEWIRAFQDSERRRQQWIVIWLKAYGCRVKTILRHVDFQKTKLYEEYKLGMAHLLSFLQVGYTKRDLENLEYYKPELIPHYPAGKVTGTAIINVLEQWLAEIKKKV